MPPARQYGGCYGRLLIRTWIPGASLGAQALTTVGSLFGAGSRHLWGLLAQLTQPCSAPAGGKATALAAFDAAAANYQGGGA